MCKKREEEEKKENLNIVNAIKKYDEYFVLPAYFTHISSYHGSDCKSNSHRSLIKDRDVIFQHIQENFLRRKTEEILNNDNFTIEKEEVIDPCSKTGKLLVLFDMAFSLFYTKRGQFVN